jgi:hypothetical protein
MSADGSAYAVLGLEPDADWPEIDRAYKRLIKRYHPDRDGGDPQRAAEINRAYRELRGRPGPTGLDFHEPEKASGSGRGWVHFAMALIVGVAALLAATGPVTALIRQLSAAPRIDVGRSAGLASPGDPMDQPIHMSEVTSGIAQAVHSARAHDDAALLNASRECHRQLRTHPAVALLDRCAAFDDAVVQLQNKDAMWDGGPFGDAAVTRRQWNAASALSNDYLAVDGRLDRIRLQVELALAAPPDAGAENR